MKKLIALTAGAVLMAGCQSTAPTAIGGKKDAHGCFSSAGYSYSVLKKECVQPFDIADITLTDSKNDTLAVYVILSDDRQFAEVFAADLPTGTVLTAVKGGYLSNDGKVRLLNTGQEWRLMRP